MIRLEATIAVFFTLVVMDAKTQAMPDALSQASPALKQPVQLTAFADRVTMKKDETFNVRVWVESKLLDTAVITVRFAKGQLTLKGEDSRPVPLPMNAPETFVFTAHSEGKFNIFLYFRRFLGRILTE